MLAVELTKKDIQEVENNYNKLSEFLVNNYTSFNACAFILQVVQNAVKEIKNETLA